MSCMVSAKTAGNWPVTWLIKLSKSSLVRKIQPSFTVGLMANPRLLIMRLPRVVSTVKMALMSGWISWRFIVSMSTCESINGTGWCGMTGEFGHTCVAKRTRPGKTSPFAAISASLRAAASATAAPSPSETMPIWAGRAPTPPSRPMMPSVGPEPSPGRLPDTKSVPPVLPSMWMETASATPRSRSKAATCSPFAFALSSIS